MAEIEKDGRINATLNAEMCENGLPRVYCPITHSSQKARLFYHLCLTFKNHKAESF